MRRTVLFFALTGLLLPLVASAQFGSGAIFRSFGGRVLTVTPCTLGLHVLILPAGAFPIAYIWTPATRTGLFGPPRPGVSILGTAYPFPTACATFGGFPLPGLIMAAVGTSASFGAVFNPTRIGSLY